VDKTQIESLISSNSSKLAKPLKIEPDQALVPIDEKSPLKIEPDQALVPIDEYFTCKICLNVVIDPKECKTCNTLTCS
jgi:hypothetical protein